MLNPVCIQCKKPLTPGSNFCPHCGLAFNQPVPIVDEKNGIRKKWHPRIKVFVTLASVFLILFLFLLPYGLNAKNKADKLAAIMNPIVEQINSNKMQGEIADGQRIDADSVEWPYHGHVTEIRVVLEPLWDKPVEYGGESKEWLERRWSGCFVSWCLQAGYSDAEANTVTIHFEDKAGNNLGDISPVDFMRRDGIAGPGS